MSPSPESCLSHRKHRLLPQGLDTVEYQHNTGWKRLLRLVLYAVGLLTAFMLGRQSIGFGLRDYSTPIQLRSIPQTFRYNATLGDSPSPETNDAWKSLFPTQGGFFKHPEIAPERSGFAVFHTLHCIDGLRHGYYAMYAAMLEGRPLNTSALPLHASPAHARHCIDLLRQNVMCQPDLTVEIVDEEIGGVTGFGTEHQCKDWDQLNTWVGRWEGWHHRPKHSHGGDDGADDARDIIRDHGVHGEHVLEGESSRPTL